MLFDEFREIKTGRRELRNFGVLVGSVFAALGILAWVRGRTVFPYLLTPGVALLALGLVLPRSLKPIYVPWMALAIVLGFAVSNVLLTLLFYLVVTPIGLVARCFGRDFLRLKIDPKADTYWIRRENESPKSAAEYERQF